MSDVTLTTQRITANDSTGQPAAWAEKCEDRWAIHVQDNMRVDERLGREVNTEASKRAAAQEGRQIAPRMVGSVPRLPVVELEPHNGGLLLPERTHEQDVRQTLREVAQLVDGWRAADRKALETAVRGILATVAGAGAPKLPMGD